MSRSAYSEVVLDHFKNPRNVGILVNPDAFGKAENPASGASIQLFLEIKGQRVFRATFQAQGCTATIAASSVLTEMLIGLTIDEIETISRLEIEKILDGLPPTRKHAADLAKDVARSAAKNYWDRVV